MTNTKTLHRSDNRMLAGVCAGVAEYFGIDTTLVRVLTAVTILLVAPASCSTSPPG